MKLAWVVLDASVVIKAILPNPLQRHCQACIAGFSNLKPAAPMLWAYETTSAITKAVHFKQITEAEALLALGIINALGVQLFIPDEEHNIAAFQWAKRLKRASAYDAYYLALAQTLECHFWTADNRLINALKDANVDWLHHVGEMKPLE
ncbi:MAG: type II toxin-antitoxin system VapC family toxin [Anaerolineae bacterium]|nr:type II toxin-antitoxin system VapC family toxin [Anaerolineae bacterium]